MSTIECMYDNDDIDIKINKFLIIRKIRGDKLTEDDYSMIMDKMKDAQPVEVSWLTGGRHTRTPDGSIVRLYDYYIAMSRDDLWTLYSDPSLDVMDIVIQSFYELIKDELNRVFDPHTSWSSISLDYHEKCDSIIGFVIDGERNHNPENSEEVYFRVGKNACPSNDDEIVPGKKEVSFNVKRPGQSPFIRTNVRLLVDSSCTDEYISSLKEFVQTIISGSFGDDYLDIENIKFRGRPVKFIK